MIITMSEIESISKLADILHQNGDKVLNGLSKLSLNATFLQKINKEFELFLVNENINESNNFQVIASGNSNSQLMQNLHFLHDFIQKTIGLKITNSSKLSLLENSVDVSKFKSIKYLEIRKVPIKEITGLKMVQSQLESIVCIKCMSKLEELLAECGGDATVGFVWSELREVVINYNNISTIDTSIAFAPWLQILDLSHNQIKHVEAVECLPNLKYINLSFNCLSSVPTFSKSARKKILVLVLKNNYIEDLSGLSGLDHLMELDVSWNWVSNHTCLQPLLTMSALQNLTMRGNPISYHKNYKHSVVGYLHISASLCNFILDDCPLSKSEKSIVGNQLYHPSRSSRATPVESAVNSPAAETPNEETRSLDKCNSGKKSGKVRLAVIPNLDDGTYEEIPADINAVSLKDSMSEEHLLTKKKIEEARATYGSDNWLRCEAGNVVQDILGLPISEPLSSTPLDDYCLESALKSEENIIQTVAIIENNSCVGKENKTDESFATCDDAYPSNYYSISDIDSKVERTEEDSKGEGESKETSPDFEPIQKPDDEDEDENEKIYLALRIMKVEDENQSEELFLSVTDLELKEKDTNRGSIINKWCISSLESCTRIQSNKLQLTFDTVKRDKRERTYEMEESDIIELYRNLSHILENRTLLDMYQIAYNCVSCSSQFSKIINSRKRDLSSHCPFCNSSFILEADDDFLSNKDKDAHLKASQKSSSIADAQGVSKQTSDKLVTGSSESSIGSAASLDELNENAANRKANAKRSDSEIETLSNPSQSSIGVIDDPRMTGTCSPGRKKSSEYRQQPIVLPNNLTQISRIGGLTESSSSGSVTDSICTAYENNSSCKPVIHKPSNTELRKEDDFKAVRDKRISNEEKVVENKNAKSEQKSLSSAPNKIRYFYMDFTKVDHRIKLLLYSKIFEDNEDFRFLLRSDVLMLNSAKSFPSCVVCSNKKLYILKVIGSEEGDDASSFLQKSKSLQFNLNSIKSITILMWHQGFSVKLGGSHDEVIEFLILIKDQKRTENFLKFLQSFDLNLPTNCKIITESPQKPILAMQHLLLSGISEDSNIQYFCLLNSCSVSYQSDIKNVEAGSVLLNSIDILLFSSEPKWLTDGPDQPPQPVFRQKISNLANVEIECVRIYLQFLMEVDEKEEIWSLTMESQEEVNNFINAVKSPWEEFYAVPLQISVV